MTGTDHQKAGARTGPAAPTARPGQARWAWRCALVPGLAATAFGVALMAAASRQGLWYDETYTAGVIGEPGHRFWSELARNDQSFAPYYVLAKAWSELVGVSDVALRSLTACAHVAATALLWMVLRRRLGATAALVGAVVLGGGLLLLQQAVTARPYALVTLATVGLFGLGLATMESRRRARWAGFCLVAATLPWISPLAGIGAGLALLGPVLWSMRRDLAAAGVGLAVMTVSWVADVIAVLATPTDPHTTGSISRGWLVETAVLAGGGGWLFPVVAVLSAPAVIAVIAGVSSRGRPTRTAKPIPDAEVVTLGLALVVVPACLTLALGLAEWQVYSRYVLGSAVGLAVLCGWAVPRIPARLAWAAWLIPVLAFIQFCLVFWPMPTGHRDDWRIAASRVDRLVAAGDGLLTPSPQMRIPLSWHARRRAAGAFGESVWPRVALGAWPPSRSYDLHPFRPGDKLPASLPDRVWVLVYPTEATAADAARDALRSKGYREVIARRLWSDRSAPPLVLEGFSRAGQPPPRASRVTRPPVVGGARTSHDRPSTRQP